MLYFISAATIATEDLTGKCQFCHKKESIAGTKTCSTCKRRLSLRSRNIWAGVPKRAPRYNFEDDPGGSYDNARRAREDGR